MKLSPQNQRRWQNFRANRRGWWSLWIFVTLLVVSLPAEKRLAAIRMTSSTGGNVPSGNVACAISVITSSRGFARRSSM